MTFSPARVAISSITQANPCVVTTSSNHNMTTGQVVKIHVPQNYGMFNLNNHHYHIKVLSPTTFSLWLTLVPVAVSVDSTNFPAFSIPSNPGFTAEVLAAGAGPTPLSNTPVQIQNGICDSLIEDATTNISTSEIPF